MYSQALSEYVTYHNETEHRDYCHEDTGFLSQRECINLNEWLRRVQ